MDFLLLCCGAVGLLEVNVDSISKLGVLRGVKKFLVGTASTDWSCGRAFGERGLLPFLAAH